MPGEVDLVKRLNDRHIQRSPSQLALRFGNGRVGGHGVDSDLSFNAICSNLALFEAWEKFRRGKKSRMDVQLFERHLEENVFELQRRLARGLYEHGAYTPFNICDPKPRLIHKATVRDRLVHQAIVSAIEPLFEPQFIYDSFSCRNKKGIHAGVKRLDKFLHQASRNNTRTVYALKCDVSRFFASVNHQVLRELLRRRIKDERIMSLIEIIIDSHSSKTGKGMPLGNLTSQLFANIYLHELDWFVKHGLREKHYLRYCDDFIILSTDRQHLEQLIPEIKAFLKQQLKLDLHPHKVIMRSWRQGIDFLGYVLKPGCVLIRHKTKNRMLKRVNRDNLTSYLGLCSHANSYGLQKLIKSKAWAAGADYYEYPELEYV